jgi:hypothetical protein
MTKSDKTLTKHIHVVDSQIGKRFVVRVYVIGVSHVRMTLGSFDTLKKATFVRDEYLRTGVVPPHVMQRVRFENVYKKDGLWFCEHDKREHGPFDSIFKAAQFRNLKGGVSRRKLRKSNIRAVVPLKPMLHASPRPERRPRSRRKRSNRESSLENALQESEAHAKKVQTEEEARAAAQAAALFKAEYDEVLCPGLFWVRDDLL